MSADVVSLNGGTASGQPSEEIVTAIEELLEMARRGEIVSIGAAFVSPNNTVHTIISHSGQPVAHQLVAGSAYLHVRCLQAAGVDAP